MNCIIVFFCPKQTNKADLVGKADKVLVCTGLGLKEGADGEYEQDKLKNGPARVILVRTLDVALDDS